jgi:DNA-binding MarR family transcriptional regulator
VSTEPIRQAAELEPTDGYSLARIRSLLHRAELAGQRERALRAREQGTRAIEMLALEHLAVSRMLTPSELGRRLGLTSGGVTALVDRLLGDGCVERRPHPHDGRMRTLVLTEAGVARTRDYMRAVIEPPSLAAACLSPADRAVVGRFLELVVTLRRGDAERAA